MARSQAAGRLVQSVTARLQVTGWGRALSIFCFNIETTHFSPAKLVRLVIIIN